MRTSVMTAVVAAAALLVAATPAAASVTDAQILAARDAMVTKAEAKALGIKSDSMNFNVTESQRGHMWLCDLGNASGKEISIKGTRVQYSSNIEQDLGTAGMRAVEQTIYQYPSAKAASAAYSLLKTRIAGCNGTNTQNENGTTYTQAVTNGTAKVKDGDEVVWTMSVSDLTGTPNSYASHDYSVFHLDGDVIVNIELDADGSGASPITAKQRKAADELVCDLVHRS